MGTDYDSQSAYEREMRLRMARGGPAYIPSPDDIEESRVNLHFLKKECGYDDEFCAMVLTHESPHIKLVRRMVAKHGPKEARRILEKLAKDDD